MTTTNFNIKRDILQYLHGVLVVATVATRQEGWLAINPFEQ